MLLPRCSPSDQVAAFQVPKWEGTWKGTQPEHIMTNSEGNPLIIQGQQVRVVESVFQFEVFNDGKVHLLQDSKDGRSNAFNGTWRGSLVEDAPDTNAGSREPSLNGIVCDLSAESTGAYRQYALIADSAKRTVLCYGNHNEPVFALSFYNKP